MSLVIGNAFAVRTERRNLQFDYFQFNDVEFQKGHTDTDSNTAPLNANSDANARADRILLPVAGRLWNRRFEHKFTRKTKKFEGGLPPSDAGQQLELHYSLPASQRL